MSQEFKVPELGENIHSGTVTKVLITEGGKVARDQGVVELETGKAVLEIPSTVEGLVEKILVKAGDEVMVGQPLFRVKTEGAAEGEGAAEKPAEAPKAKPVRLSSQAEAAAPEIVPGPLPESAPPPAAPPPGEASAPPSSEPLPAAPSVRRLARELGVELAGIAGTGPNGRLLESDVRGKAKPEARPEERKEGQMPPAALPDFPRQGEVRREAMSPVRRATAQHMAKAWALIPHAVQFARADVTAIEALRLRHKDEVEKAGGRLSLTIILLKAVAGALKAFPRFNASVDMERRELIYKRFINLGVAMDTERGLLVPVIRDADRKNLTELAIDLARLTDRARLGKLAADDLQGGTFTITNAGALGGDALIPIVNWPEAAILAVGRARLEAVPEGDGFKARSLMPLTLSYDHRINDGADAVRFLRWLTESLEEPIRLVLKG